MNGLDPPHKAIFQPNLDPVGMCGGFCQDIPDNAFGELPGPLVLLQYNGYFHTGPNMGPFGSAGHGETSFLHQISNLLCASRVSDQGFPAPLLRIPIS